MPSRLEAGPIDAAFDVHFAAPMHALDPWLSRLSDELPIAPEGLDPEGVHRVRIALARLRVWLRLANTKDCDRSLRDVRRAASKIRDLDVHLARHLPKSLAAQLRTERAAAHRELVSVLDGPQLSRTIEHLRAMPDLDRQAAERELAAMARVALARGRAAKRHPKSSARLHRLRRSIRALRFALDWVSVCPHVLIELQDELGAVADLRAALAHVERASGRRKLRAYRRELEARMVEQRKKARACWHAVKPSLRTIASRPAINHGGASLSATRH